MTIWLPYHLEPGPAIYNTLKTTVRGYNLEELANHGKYSCNDVFARKKLQSVIITVRPHPVHVYAQRQATRTLFISHSSVN